jgi:cbb3-type cytochrome oxidase maturation protein
VTVLFVVFPLAVLLSALAAVAFIWATGRGQFDDLDTPAVRLLCDDLAARRNPSASKPDGDPP